MKCPAAPREETQPRPRLIGKSCNVNRVFPKVDKGETS